MNEELQLDNDGILQTINSTNPIHIINDKEFNISLLKYGSFLSMIKNKRINQTMLLVELLDREIFRDCFKEISGIDETKVLFYKIITKFPMLCKSKIIKTKIEEINGNGSRKKIL